MKKLTILTLLFSIGLANIYSQTTLQYSVHALKAGVDNPMSYCKYSNPGIGGKDQTWDFSQLKFEKPFIGFVGKSDQSKNKAAFSESNTVLTEFNNLFYLKITEDQVLQYGYSSSDGTSKILYSEPFVKMKFPFAYGDMYSGVEAGTIEQSGQQSGTIAGDYTVEADGYGKLILPNNTVFDNVLRVKTVKNFDNQYTDYTQHVEVTTFRWYNSVHRYPLLVTIESKTSVGSGDESVSYQAAYNSNALRALDNSLTISTADLTLYPNPALSSLNLKYNSTASGKMNIEIYDASGRQARSFVQDFTQGERTYDLSSEISGLLPGSYIMVVDFGDSRVTKDFTLIE
jgi:hypothetical protein